MGKKTNPESLIEKIENLEDGKYRNLQDMISCGGGSGLILANDPICICSGGNAHAVAQA